MGGGCKAEEQQEQLSFFLYIFLYFVGFLVGFFLMQRLPLGLTQVPHIEMIQA